MYVREGGTTVRQLGGPREVVVHAVVESRTEDSLAGPRGRGANAVGADVHTRRRRADGARRARFLVVCKYKVVWTSNARPARPTPPRRAALPRRSRLCDAPGAPHRHRRRASRAAAQRIMTRRELHKFLVAGNTVYVCATAGSARRQPRGCTDACTAGLARRSAPKGSPSADGAAAQSPRNSI